MGDDEPPSSLITSPNLAILSLDSVIYEHFLSFEISLPHTHGSLSLTSPITSSRFTRTIFPQPKYKQFLRLINILFHNSNIRKWSMFVVGIVIFDTQCDDNLVTSRFLNERVVEWQPYENGIGSSTIDGTKMEFLGEILGRWYIVKSSNRDNVPPRYEIATFKVIDCQECQVIIGRNTIKDLAMPTMFEELGPSRFSVILAR
ncbi:hypothetical protein PSV08DRAFT_252763 [Bipolaris maydis]|uniref:uncharacterized protein n=1 Tax=Cochliobolus heterostrophus TaxID=5016 RepID=UPI0024DB4E16|nr:hypothetical protein J3E73DRAFT_255931 [Bipolaris maydis]KAJ6265368.1 hypothetical protein PSV08DRAFT_252763 [Bipolaris maydis]